MKKLTIVTGLLFFCTTSFAQFGILDRAKRNAQNKVNNKIDEKINKGIDKTVDGADNEISGKNKKSGGNIHDQKGGVDEGNSPVNNTRNGGTVSFKSYSKFDFVPGEKLVAAEDFSQDALGDFPDKWNTNGSGEIVTVSNATGKFLMTKKEVVFYPEWIKNLPDNFTLEFDLLSTQKFSFYMGI